LDLFGLQRRKKYEILKIWIRPEGGQNADDKLLQCLWTMLGFLSLSSASKVRQSRQKILSRNFGNCVPQCLATISSKTSNSNGKATATAAEPVAVYINSSRMNGSQCTCVAEGK